jgi:hypothetical protein
MKDDSFIIRALAVLIFAAWIISSPYSGWWILLAIIIMDL